MAGVPEQMDWTTRLLGASIGAVGSFLAIGCAPPASYREGCFRVSVGFFVAFVFTGLTCEKIGESSNSYNAVLAIAAAWGVGAWWFMASFITFAKNSDISFLAKLAGFFIGPKTLPKPDEEKKG